MNKKLLTVALAAGIALTALPFAAQAADNHDLLDSNINAYVAERQVDVSAAGEGSLDLTRLRRVGPPMAVEFELVNNGQYPVEVVIPDLDSSFLVPANSVREHHIAVTEVGVWNEVPYTVSQIIPAAVRELDMSSAAYILSSSYTQYDASAWENRQERAVEEYTPVAQPASNEYVRGYW